MAGAYAPAIAKKKESHNENTKRSVLWRVLRSLRSCRPGDNRSMGKKTIGPRTQNPSSPFLWDRGTLKDLGTSEVSTVRRFQSATRVW
jgi:hypothetical protein